MPSEIRQTERQPQYHNTHGITYMWNLKERKTKVKVTETESRNVGATGLGVGWEKHGQAGKGTETFM